MATLRILLGDYVNYHNIVISVLLSLLISIAVSIWKAPQYPTSIPWVGHGKGWKAALLNFFAVTTKSTQWIQEGYEQHSRKGQPFVLPGGFGMRAEAIIPKDQVQWMIDQPDSVLSVKLAHSAILHYKYSFGHTELVLDPYHGHVLYKCLPRNLGDLVPGMEEEVRYSVDKLFSLNESEWTNVNVLKAFMRLVPMITNRILIDSPLCREQDYLENMAAYAMDVVRCMLLFGVLPNFMRPILGQATNAIAKYHANKTLKYSLPFVQKRLSDFEKKAAGDPEYKNWKPPNDYLTWAITTAVAEGRIDETDLKRLALRLCVLNFASTHTTAMTGHAVMLDFVSADPAVLAELREEACRIHAEEGGKWTKQGLARMYKMDSAIRESQRHSSFALTMVHRVVAAPEGIVGPDGTHYAKGVMISCPWGPISQDKGIFTQADTFDPFRSSTRREAFTAKDPDQRDPAEELRIKQSGLVTTSSNNLAFSHGRHACPARFFVSFELKMLFAYILMNYDIKRIEKPKGFWLGRNFVPPSSASIEVRRKKGTT